MTRFLAGEGRTVASGVDRPVVGGAIDQLRSNALHGIGIVPLAVPTTYCRQALSRNCIMRGFAGDFVARRGYV